MVTPLSTQFLSQLETISTTHERQKALLLVDRLIAGLEKHKQELISSISLKEEELIQKNAQGPKIKKTKKIFKCDVRRCEKVYSTKYALKRHMNVHLDKKEHLCHICGSRFNLP